MTENPPGSWDVTEESQHGLDEDGSNRPSTAETYVTTGESISSLQEEHHEVKSSEKGKDTIWKQRIERMPELPPEIRETYAPPPRSFGGSPF